MNLRQKNKRLKKELERYENELVPSKRVVIDIPRNVKVLRSDVYMSDRRFEGVPVEQDFELAKEEAMYKLLTEASKYVNVRRVREFYTDREKIIMTLLVVEDDNERRYL